MHSDIRYECGIWSHNTRSVAYQNSSIIEDELWGIWSDMVARHPALSQHKDVNYVNYFNTLIRLKPVIGKAFRDRPNVSRSEYSEEREEDFEAVYTRALVDMKALIELTA
jgi:hypothetical protein